MAGTFILFFILAVTAIAAAIGMLVSRNAVYSALFLIVNFATVAVIYLTLGAPFIALAQITIYAGAIMVLFLFVIMLLGAEKLAIRGKAPAWQQALGTVLGLLVMGEAAYLIVFRSRLAEPLALPSSNFASPAAIGLVLFKQYLLPFEVTSVLLLVAMVGAIVLTRPGKTIVGSHLVTAETISAGKSPLEEQQGDLMVYEKQIESEEVRGKVAGPNKDDVSRR